MYAKVNVTKSVDPKGMLKIQYKLKKEFKDKMKIPDVYKYLLNLWYLFLSSTWNIDDSIRFTIRTIS